MDNNNLKLWKSVETTDPGHIQRAKVSGQQRTTVKAVWQKEKATEIFGIQGIKWGVRLNSERFDRFELPENETMLQYLAVLYFEYEGEKGEIPIAAAIMESQTVKRGTDGQYLRVDPEAIKKVRTDAMTKGLSELGFNADIFKGFYDSAGYSDYALDITAEQREEEQTKQAIEEAESYAEWRDKELGYYETLNTVKAINTAFNGHVRKATKMNDKRGILAFTKAKDARIEQLKKEAKEEETNG